MASSDVVWLSLYGKQEESDRLDLQDFLFRATFDGKLALNPLAKTARRVLDIGTGTGLWAVQYGEFRGGAVRVVREWSGN